MTSTKKTGKPGDGRLREAALRGGRGTVDALVDRFRRSSSEGQRPPGNRRVIFWDPSNRCANVLIAADATRSAGVGGERNPAA